MVCWILLNSRAFDIFVRFLAKKQCRLFIFVEWSISVVNWMTKTYCNGFSWLQRQCLLAIYCNSMSTGAYYCWNLNPPFVLERKTNKYQIQICNCFKEKKIDVPYSPVSNWHSHLLSNAYWWQVGFILSIISLIVTILTMETM